MGSLDLRPAQLAQLSEAARDAFVRKTAAQIHALHPDHERSHLEQVVSETVAMGRAVHLYAQQPIAKLSRLRVALGYDLPLHQVLHDALTNYEQTEDERVDAFELALTLRLHRLVTVSLETPLRAEGW